jgi:hypothetical protein
MAPACSAANVLAEAAMINANANALNFFMFNSLL